MPIAFVEICFNLRSGEGVGGAQWDGEGDSYQDSYQDSYRWQCTDLRCQQGIHFSVLHKVEVPHICYQIYNHCDDLSFRVKLLLFQALEVLS